MRYYLIQSNLMEDFHIEWTDEIDRMEIGEEYSSHKLQDVQAQSFETFENFNDLTLHDTRRQLITPGLRESDAIKVSVQSEEQMQIVKPQSQLIMQDVMPKISSYSQDSQVDQSSESMVLELSPLKTIKTGNQVYQQDSGRCLSFVDQVTANEQLSDIYIPSNMTEFVQTLQLPNDPDHFITVQRVSLNVAHHLKQKERAPEFMLCSSCSKSIHLTQEEQPTEYKHFCKLCNNDCSTYYYRCQNKKTKQVNIRKKKLNKQLSIEDEAESEKTLNTDSCNGVTCCQCFNDYYLRRFHEQKNSMHYYWTSKDFGSDDIPESQIIAVIALWQHSKESMICKSQYFVDDPIFFTLQDEVIQKGHEEISFIFKNELHDLFIFTRKSEQVILQKLQFSTRVADQKRFLKFQMQQENLYTISQDSDAASDWVKQVFYSKITEKGFCRFMPKIVKNQLIFQIDNIKQKSKSTEISASLGIIDYVSRTSKIIDQAYIFLGLRQQPEQEILVYILSQSFQICCYRWSTLTDQNFISLNEGAQFIEELFEPVFAIQTSNNDDKIEDLVSPDLEGFIYDDGNKCTVLSKSKMQWLTYQLDVFDQQRKRFLVPIQKLSLVQQNYDFQYFISDDTLYICQVVRNFQDIITNEWQSYQIQVILHGVQNIMDIDVEVPQQYSTCISNSNLILQILDFNPSSQNFTSTFLYQNSVSSENSLMYLNGSLDKSQESVRLRPLLFWQREQITNYPFICQNSFHPAQNRLVLTNVTINCPQTVIKIEGGYKFVKFLKLPPGAMSQNDLHVYTYVLVCKGAHQVRILRLKMNPFQDPLDVNVVNYSQEILAGDVMGKLSMQQPIQSAFCQYAKLGDDDPKFTQIIIQRHNSIEIYSDGQLQQLEKITNSTQVPMICCVNFMYFFVKRLVNGDQVIVIYIDPDNQRLITVSVIQQHQTKIMQIQVSENEQRKNRSNCSILDENGEIRFFIVQFEGNTIVSKEIQFIDKAQTILKEDKYRFKILDRVRKHPWTRIIFNHFYIYVMNENGLHIKNCLNKQTKDVDSLKINLKCYESPQNYSQSVLTMYPIDQVFKNQFLMKSGDFCFNLIQQNPKELQRDFISTQLAQQCENVHFHENMIVFQLKSKNGMLWAYFNQQTQMLIKVLKFDEFEQARLVRSVEQKIVPFVVVLKKNSQDSSLYSYPSGQKLEQDEIITSSFNFLIEKENSLFQSINQHNIPAISGMQCHMNEPILLNDGRSTLLWFLNTKSGYIKPETSGKKISKQQQSYVKIIKVYTKERTLPFQQKLGISKFRSVNGEWQQKQFRSSTFQKNENIRQFASQEEESRPGTNISYLIIDPDEKLITNFKMQVLVTDKYLVWTTPEHINFIEKEEISDIITNENLLMQKIEKGIQMKIQNQEKNPFSQERNILQDFLAQERRPTDAQQRQSDNKSLLTKLNILLNSKPIKKQSISLGQLFPAQVSREISIFNICEIDRVFLVRDYFETDDKKSQQDESNLRKNIIQIRSHDVSMVWDLEQYEEITFLVGWNQFMLNEKTFVRTGHNLSTNRNQIIQNEDATLFIKHNIPKKGPSTIQTFKLFSELDMITLKYLQEMVQKHLNINQDAITPTIANANFFNRHVFSIFSNQHQIIGHLKNFILNLDQTPVEESEIEICQEFDQIELRRTNQILLMPTIIGNGSLERSLLAQSLELQPRKIWCSNEEISTDRYKIKKPSTNLFQILKSGYHKKDTKSSANSTESAYSSASYDIYKQQVNLQTVYRYSLHNDGLFFNYLCEIVCKLREARLSHIVCTFSDFDRIFNNLSASCTEFLNKSYIQTGFTKKIKALKNLPNQKSIFFQADTPLLNDQQIQTEFDRVISKKVNKKNWKSFLGKRKLVLQPFEIGVLEIEWLENNITKFFQRIARTKDERIFENRLVKFFLDKVNYKKEIVVYVFLPFLVYSAICIYYNTFILPALLTQETFNYFQGTHSEVICRIMIAIFTFVFLLIELWQIKSDPRQYIVVDGFVNIQYLSFLSIHIFLTTQHPNAGLQIQGQYLSMISSVACVLIYYHLYGWLRIFRTTSLYVQMITQTIWDVKTFVLFFMMCICTFGNGVLIIDKFQKLNNDEQTKYVSLIDLAVGNEVLDTFFSQYMSALGQFDTTNYATNQGKFLIWIYFLATTFITNIMIFNMLIAIMQTTYDRVRANEKIHTLMTQTKIQTKNLFLLGKRQPFGSSRYLYIAQPVMTKTQNVFDVPESIRNINATVIQGMQKESSNTQKIIGLLRSKCTEIQEKASEYQEETKRLVELDKLSEELQYKSQISKMNSLFQKVDKIELNQSEYQQKIEEISNTISNLNRNMELIAQRLLKQSEN